ncbi:MAG: histidine kinase [Saprospirales bacterium]|nr:histidine kinase [Saprospirales bacterium]MBK8923282.1 histidine kinase [Saprospirales bacterium]
MHPVTRQLLPIKRAFYVLWLLVAAQALGAQAPVFRVRPTKDQRINHLRAVFQDHRGWMWFGGESGLFRYDGLSFQTVFLPDTLAGDPVSALFESGGNLWVGFESGAIGYLPANTVFLTALPHDTKARQRTATPLLLWSPEEGTPRQAITGFCAAPDGSFWIATYGEGLYCRFQNRLYQFGPDDGLAGPDVYAIACDGLGRVWAATDAGISICSMTAEGKKQIWNLSTTGGLPDEIVSALMADQEGNMLIGTYDHGVCRYNIREQRFDYFTPDWAFGPVNSLAAFGTYEIWAGTAQNGPVRLELNRQRQAPANIHTLPAQHPLRRQKIAALCKDREGLLWVLEHKGAIYSANVRIGLLQPLFSSTQAVCVDRQNRLWAGSPQGLFVREGDVFRQVLPGNQNVLSLWEAPNGDIWAGTFGNGVFVLGADGSVQRHITEANGLVNGNVLSITGDSASVWLATLGGVTRYSLLRQQETATFQRELGAGYVYKVLADRKGRIWFGTDGEGLVVLENGAFRQFRQAAGQPLKTVYSLAEDRQGNIWFSTAEDGLFRYDGTAFMHYTTEEHLHSMSIAGLCFDGNNFLVIAYEDGVDVLTPETGHVTFYDAYSGAPTVESSLNAFCTDAYGHVWMGAQQGILRLAAFEESFVYDPEPNITAVSVFLQPLDFLKNTVFAYDQNYFLFNFTGLWYTNPELVRYRYQLVGYDHDWVVSKEHFASYPNLPPGQYTFRLQASEHGEFEGTPEVHYAFRIKPPFWERWWFVALSLAAAGLLLYYLIRLREARFHREAALRRESVESQFAALKSQINPHFLFNSFNTLITIIEENPEIAVEYVEHLSDFYRSIMVYRERDLVSLSEEMEMVRNFDFLLKKRYEDSFRLDCAVNGQIGQIIPLTLQMLVENAVKHNIISRAKPLNVQIFVENGTYIVVRNNKQLKLKPEPSTHFGLQSLIHRYALLNAQPVIVQDTEEFFTVKIPLL